MIKYKFYCHCARLDCPIGFPWAVRLMVLGGIVWLIWWFGMTLSCFAYSEELSDVATGL